MDLTGLGCVSVAESSEYSYEPSYSMKAEEFLAKLCDCSFSRGTVVKSCGRLHRHMGRGGGCDALQSSLGTSIMHGNFCALFFPKLT